MIFCVILGVLLWLLCVRLLDSRLARLRMIRLLVFLLVRRVSLLLVLPSRTLVT